jgi:hypothetical protein
MGLILMIITCFTFLNHLSDNFWVDEFYTLIHFVLVPVEITLQDYHVPNNHILFSLLSKIYFSLIGYSNLTSIIEHPVIARLPLVVMAIVILFVYWKTTAFYFKDPHWRMISLILLSSNAVFGNFVLQYRGYGLSMLFLSIIFLLLNMIIYSDKKGNSLFVGLMLASFGAFYTIPSNLYFIVALGFYLGLLHLQLNGFKRFHLKNPAMKAGAFLLVGILFGLLAYLPVFAQVFNNEYINNSTPFAFGNFESFAKTLIGLSSFHYLLLILGIYYLLAKIILKQLNPISRFLFPFTVVCLPVVFSFIHGDVPPNRVYSVVIPFFSIMLTQSLILISGRIRYLKGRKAFFILPIYLLLHFFMSEFYINKRLAYNNLIGKRSHSLLLQYHNYHFNSLEFIQVIKSDFRDFPVYFKEKFDGMDMLTDIYEIPTSVVEPDSIAVESCIFITNKPLPQHGMNFESEIINDGRDYIKLYRVRGKSDLSDGANEAKERKVN